jgi:hypothetical protein
MARGVITLTQGGFEGWIDELEQLVEKMPEMTLKALKARQEVIEAQIRENWVARGGSYGGFVYDSVGQSATYSKINPVDVVGTIGVYDIDSVKSAHGKTNKDLNAAQIAYWVEYGTSRLKAGGRKLKGVEYSDEQLITVMPQPFITQAFYQTIDEQDVAFKRVFNSEYDQVVK